MSLVKQPFCFRLAQLRFTSFAVASLREDLYLQECACAGRTRPGRGLPRPFCLLGGLFRFLINKHMNVVANCCKHHNQPVYGHYVPERLAEAQHRGALVGSRSHSNRLLPRVCASRRLLPRLVCPACAKRHSYTTRRPKNFVCMFNPGVVHQIDNLYLIRIHTPKEYSPMPAQIKATLSNFWMLRLRAA